MGKVHDMGSALLMGGSILGGVSCLGRRRVALGEDPSLWRVGRLRFNVPWEVKKISYVTRKISKNNKMYKRGLKWDWRDGREKGRNGKERKK